MADDADEHVHCFPIGWGRRLRPEESLAVAVLEDAIRTLQRHAVADDRTARMLVAEVDAWLACDDTDHPFTFVSICDALALDAAHVRSGLRHRRRSRRVALPVEPRILRLPRRGRPRGRVTPSSPPTAPATSHAPRAGGSGQ